MRTYLLTIYLHPILTLSEIWVVLQTIFGARIDSVDMTGNYSMDSFKLQYENKIHLIFNNYFNSQKMKMNYIGK